MNKMLARFKIQLLVALATGLFVYFFPVMTNSGKYAAWEFWGAFGSLAVISYVLYLFFYFLFSAVFQRFSWSSKSIYLAHALALLAGYYLFYSAFVSIGRGGIPTIF